MITPKEALSALLYARVIARANGVECEFKITRIEDTLIPHTTTHVLTATMTSVTVPKPIASHEGERCDLECGNRIATGSKRCRHGRRPDEMLNHR